MKLNLFPFICLGALIIPAIANCADTASQDVRVSSSLQIPGATLQPGTYKFAVEDHLQDRAIVRVTSEDGGNHYLLLTVPSAHASSADANGFSYYSGNDGQAVKTWKCPDCSAPLEFVYPKMEAVALTDASTEPVLAVDPASDKLPANLSADDMKVVTLWLLQPERISNDKGVGVKAAKYQFASNASAPVQENNAQGTQMASAAPHQTRHLPRTGTNTFSLALYGMLLIAGGVLVRLTRPRQA